LRLAGIKSIPAANKFLHEEFLPKYWSKQNTVPARGDEVKYKPLTPEIDLNEVFTFRENRQVKGNHTIWGNQIYNVRPYNEISIKGREIELRTYQNMATKAFFAGVEIEITKAVEQKMSAKPNNPALRMNKVVGINRDTVTKICEENLEREKNWAKVTKRGRPKKLPHKVMNILQAS
jgi:hypothetical protein